MHPSLREIVAHVDPGVGSFIVGSMGNGGFVQYSKYEPDVHTKQGKVHRGRKWYVSKFATRDEIFRTCLLAVRTFEEHEVYERFKVDGKQYLNPHPEGGRTENQTSWETIY